MTYFRRVSRLREILFLRVITLRQARRLLLQEMWRLFFTIKATWQVETTHHLRLSSKMVKQAQVLAVMELLVILVLQLHSTALMQRI